MASIQTSTIVYASIGTALGGALAYAAYFDYKRRNDVEFRKSLKKESKKQEKAAKVQAHVQGKQRIQEIHGLVDEFNAEEMPPTEERETVFMSSINDADRLQNTGDEVGAALNYFKALKMYPAQQELMKLYDSSVPKPILDIIAQMMAYDRLSESRSSNSSSAGVE